MRAAAALAGRPASAGLQPKLTTQAKAKEQGCDPAFRKPPECCCCAPLGRAAVAARLLASLRRGCHM